MIPSPRAALLRFDPRRQVAVGRARVQDARSRLDRVRRRQGGHQRGGGEAGAARARRRSHRGESAARAAPHPEGRCHRRPARLGGGRSGALRGSDAPRAAAPAPGAAAVPRARRRSPDQAAASRNRTPPGTLMRAIVGHPEESVMERYDWTAIVDGLNRYLRLRSIPIGMKLFETVEAMEAIPKIRRPKSRHTTDQIVAQARQLGWTVGITMADLIGAQCGAVIGLHPQDDEWLSGRRMAGVWFKSVEDASLHQHAMDCVPHGRYRAMAVSPLTSGRLDPPDICLIYGTPGQMIFFINGLQWTGYKKLSFTSVGESACADSWGKALKTGEPALTIPCYAERRYGGVADDELLMAIPPRFLPKVIEGLAALDRNGLRYPVPPFGIQSDAGAGLAVSYAGKDSRSP